MLLLNTTSNLALGYKTFYILVLQLVLHTRMVHSTVYNVMNSYLEVRLLQLKYAIHKDIYMYVIFLHMLLVINTET